MTNTPGDKMKTYEIDCWEVTQPDGGGMRSEHLCYASSKKVADEIAASLGKGWPKNAERYTKLFSIMESVDDYHANTKKALMKSAAEKLTPAERQVFGIDKEGKKL
jgi:hypothetical protein